MRKVIEQNLGAITENSRGNLLPVILIAFFCSATILLPIYVAGMPYGQDLSSDFRFAEAYKETLLKGNLVPSWSNDNLGFGSIGIRFYPPVSVLVMALTILVTGNWFDSVAIDLFLWASLGSVGIYFFVKEWTGQYWAVFAALLYAVIPYRLYEVYQLFLYAEFAAASFIPFCFLFATRVVKFTRWSDAVSLSLFFSLVALTHIPTTIIAFLGLLVYVFVLADWHNWRRLFYRLTVSAALSICAVSFHWLRIVTEMTWLAHNNFKYTSSYYSFAHRLFPNSLETRSFFLETMGDWMLDVTIVLTLLLLIPGLFCVCKTVRRHISSPKVLFSVCVTAFFAFLMLSRVSGFVWQGLWFLQRIQFPWRWLSLMSVLSVVSFSIAAPALLRSYVKLQRLIVYGSTLAMLLIVLFDITQVIVPSQPVSRSKFENTIIDWRTEPIFQGWWPVWAKRAAFKDSDRAFARNRQVDIEAWKSEDRKFIVGGGESTSIRIATFYYPYWKTSVNGSTVEVSKDENGVIEIPIPAERSEVTLYFEEPLRNKIAMIVSLFAWAALFVLLVVFYRRRNDLNVMEVA